MSKKLIVLNYQRDIPAFVNNILKKSINEFEDVYYVSPTINSDNSLVSGVNFKQQNRFIWVLSILASAVEILSLNSINCIMMAIKSNKFGIKFIKSHLTMIACSRILYNQAKRIIKDNNTADITILAIWFWSESLALAKLKKRFNYIRSVSYAHSFEVDINKNLFVGYSMNPFRHRYIDLIIFISKTIMDNYYSLVDEIYPVIDSRNALVNYLGTEKPYEGKTFFSLYPDLRIVSCSSITPVKRINLIVDALSNINDINVTWEHFGDGPLMDQIKKAVNGINKNNIKVIFHGKVQNRDILKKYSMSNYDLFINVSDSEGLPVSIMEAMSYGIPVLATDVGGNREIVTRDTGFLIDSDSTGIKIAESISNYSKIPNEIKVCIQENCIQIWNEKFNSLTNYNRLFMFLHDKNGDNI